MFCPGRFRVGPYCHRNALSILSCIGCDSWVGGGGGGWGGMGWSVLSRNYNTGTAKGCVEADQRQGPGLDNIFMTIVLRGTFPYE
jgi:hypothetical protein